MKITDLKPVVGPEPVAAGGSTSAGGTATGIVDPKDRISIGSTGPAPETIALAKRSANAGRAARVDQLASQVRSGSYHPDPSAIAEQILSDAEVDARLQATTSH